MIVMVHLNVISAKKTTQPYIWSSIYWSLTIASLADYLDVLMICLWIPFDKYDWRMLNRHILLALNHSVGEISLFKRHTKRISHVFIDFIHLLSSFKIYWRVKLIRNLQANDHHHIRVFYSLVLEFFRTFLSTSTKLYFRTNFF